MARKYAEGTEVSVTTTRVELEETLQRYGAQSMAFFTASNEAKVGFEMRDRRVVLSIRLPDRNDRRFTHSRVNQFAGEVLRAPESAAKAWEAACRQKWRALLLAVKAKLVSVDEGVETFEEAFMAHIMLPSGRTVAEEIAPRIAQNYRDNTAIPLLPAPRGKS